jgi:hypothetical protein
MERYISEMQSLKRNILLVIILAPSFGGQLLEGENKLNYIGGLSFL